MSEFFTKMSSDDKLVTLHLNHTRNHWHNTVYTLYFDALYGVLVQYVLLYCDLCDFVTILSQFTLFCRDEMIGAKYALSQALSTFIDV